MGTWGAGRMTRRQWLGLLAGGAAAAALVGVAEAATPTPMPTRAVLGTNLGGLVDWSPEFTFANIFKQSRAWFSGTATGWSDARTLDLDERGWVRTLEPGQWARTMMFAHQAMVGRYPAGRYVVTYEGEGALAYSPNTRVVERAPGREVIEVDNRSFLGLFLTATTPGNYLRNVSVRLPGEFPADITWYPPFLETIKNYRAIRFTNWTLGQNNNSIVQEQWADRPTIKDARWSIKGAPVEAMTALCNRVGAHAWFNIPHMANDEYVRGFADRVAATLDPRLKVYVEHSNETWNFVFPSSAYCQRRGLELGLSTQPFEAQLRYHTRRSREIWAIFAAALPPSRLVRVLATQASSPWLSQQMLAYEETWRQTDALAAAPYFGVRLPNMPRIVGMDLDQLFAELSNVSLPEARLTMQWQMDAAQRYGLPLIAYEGGQHLTTIGPYERDDAMNALFQAANRDPRMGALYDRYLRDWDEVSGHGLFLHLGNCAASDRGGLGYFGSLEYLAQPRAEAPKYDALQRWIEGR
jgi:hypothetical protein